MRQQFRELAADIKVGPDPAIWVCMNATQMMVEAVQAAMVTGKWGKAWIRDVGASDEEMIAANKAGIITLSRCDLTSALTDEDKVKMSASEIRYLNAEWHFVTVR